MPATHDPELGIVVITWNSEAVLPGLIESLRENLPASGLGPDDVLVVDNASADASRSIAEDAGFRVINTGANLGYAAAINVAYDAVPQRCHLLVLNPDTRLRPGAIAALMEQCNDDTVGIVVPRIMGADGRVSPSLRRRPTATRAWGEALLGGRRTAANPRLTEVVANDGANYLRVQDADWASGAAMLVTARCRTLLGRWDPTFFLYSEETEYMLRAGRHGLRIRYTPYATIDHAEGDLHSSPRLWSIAVANRIGLFRRDHGIARSLSFQAAVMANELLRMRRSPVHRIGLRSAARPSEVERGPQTGMVAFAGVDWWYHNRAHSDVQLLRRIADERPVLMVNSIGLRMPKPGGSTQPWRRIARKLSSLMRYVRTPDPMQRNFHVMTPLAIPARSPHLQAWSAAFTAWQVTRAARWFLMREPNLFITIPSAEPVSRRMPHRTLTFNRSDLQSAFPEADNSAVEEMESLLLQRSDDVLYVCHELMAKDSHTSSGAQHFIDHGVDAELFTPQPPSRFPADIAAVPGPRIGFFGGLDDYVVDFALLHRIAVELPEASLVLIGDATCSMDDLLGLPNVHWLGMRPYEDIPAYGSAFDVAIMPWLDNEWIRYCNPIKLKEYLALGLPVVSTDFPEGHRYADVIDLAGTPEEFIAALRVQLHRGSFPQAKQARRARAMEKSWAGISREVLALVDSRAGIESAQFEHDPFDKAQLEKAQLEKAQVI